MSKSVITTQIKMSETCAVKLNGEPVVFQGCWSPYEFEGKSMYTFTLTQPLDLKNSQIDVYYEDFMEDFENLQITGWYSLTRDGYTPVNVYE